MAENSRQKAILLVEDSDSAREVIAYVLREAGGYTVVTASDGAQALRLLRDGLAPCVILLDLRMSGMDGYEFRREQLADRELSQIPTVTYSGERFAASKLEDLKTPHFEKPLHLEDLLALLEPYCRSGDR